MHIVGANSHASWEMLVPGGAGAASDVTEFVENDTATGPAGSGEGEDDKEGGAAEDEEEWQI